MSTYITIWAFMLAAAISVAWALSWAIRRGQLQNTRAQAASIFDPDERDAAPRRGSPTLSTRGE